MGLRVNAKGNGRGIGEIWRDASYLIPVRNISADTSSLSDIERQEYTRSLARLGPVPNEDISGKFECVACGAILVDTPKDAQRFTVIMCGYCKRILGTWGDLQDESLRVRGAFDLNPGRVRRH
jgi:hypothetical protein